MWPGKLHVAATQRHLHSILVPRPVEKGLVNNQVGGIGGPFQPIYGHHD